MQVRREVISVIEEQAKKLYNKYKSRLSGMLNSDVLYKDFLDVLRSGGRKYVRHNMYAERHIDEAWVNAIDKTIPSLEKIIRRPRQFLKAQEEIMPIELARKINANSIKHLSVNSRLIRTVEQDESVVPSKILSYYNEDILDIYENRFVFALLLKACDFVDARYKKILENTGDKYGEFSVKGSFSQNGETADYNMQMKITQNGQYMSEHNLYALLIERVRKIRNYLREFTETEFAKVLKNCPPIKLPVIKTNLLMKAQDYYACYELWEFLDVYTKAGYEIKITDTNPQPDENMVNESEFLVLFHYFLLKNNLPGSRETKFVEFKSQRKKSPKIVRKYNSAFFENAEFPDYSRTEDSIDRRHAEITGKPVYGQDAPCAQYLEPDDDTLYEDDYGRGYEHEALPVAEGVPAADEYEYYAPAPEAAEFCACAPSGWQKFTNSHGAKEPFSFHVWEEARPYRYRKLNINSEFQSGFSDNCDSDTAHMWERLTDYTQSPAQAENEVLEETIMRRRANEMRKRNE